MPYQPLLGTLGYIVSADQSQVLLIHRNSLPDDHALGKYNGLGGKLERDEDVAAGMAREIREEAGITITDMVLRGTISWPGFGPSGEDWLGFIFLVLNWEGELLSENREGSLDWYPVADLLAEKLPMWPGDRYFLPLVFDDDPRPFHGYMPYANGEPVSWSYSRF